jgi:hypothetical protein
MIVTSGARGGTVAAFVPLAVITALAVLARVGQSSLTPANIAAWP